MGIVAAGPSLPLSAQAGEDPQRVAVQLPVVAQDMEGGFRQRDVAILGAFAPMDMDAHPVLVDVADLKIQGLMQPEPAGVDRGQIGFVLGGAHRLEDGANFVYTEHGGQALFAFGVDERQGVPIVLEHVDKKELDAAVADAHGSGGPFVDVFAVQEVVLKLLFADQLRALSVKVDQHAHGAGVALLGAFAHAGQLQGSHGLLVIVFHHDSPFL